MTRPTADNRVSDGNFVNVPPLQLSEEGIWVHSARLDEALVTAALYLGAGNLKSTCNAQDKQQPSSAVIVRLAESAGRGSAFQWSSIYACQAHNLRF
jgi:hypothetical protein